MSAARTAPETVDESYANGSQSYTLTLVARAPRPGGQPPLTLRARVHRDSYQRQSYAVVEVLTDALTWTELATAPASDWWEGTPLPHGTAAPRGAAPITAALGSVARGLLQRGAAVGGAA